MKEEFNQKNKTALQGKARRKGSEKSLEHKNKLFFEKGPTKEAAKKTMGGKLPKRDNRAN